MITLYVIIFIAGTFFGFALCWFHDEVTSAEPQPVLNAAARYSLNPEPPATGSYVVFHGHIPLRFHDDTCTHSLMIEATKFPCASIADKVARAAHLHPNTYTIQPTPYAPNYVQHSY